MTSIENLSKRIVDAASKADDHTVEVLLEDLIEAARRDGMNDLAIDLHDAGEVSGEGIDFMVANNGVKDPRKRR